MRKNSALAKWRAGEQTIGCWLSLANTHSAEMLASLEFDWICIDLQHGLLDYSDLRHMLPAIATTDVTPIVRVSGNDPKQIMKVLDAGAYGVIVPLVNNRAEAQAAISACRYPPGGTRSFGPIRAARVAFLHHPAGLPPRRMGSAALIHRGSNTKQRALGRVLPRAQIICGRYALRYLSGASQHLGPKW